MRNDYYTNSKDYINRWVVSYADFVTMLLARVRVMFAVSRLDNEKLYELNNKVRSSFSQKTTKNVTNYQEISNLKLEELLQENIPQKASVKLLRTDKGVVIRLNDKILF